MQAPSLVTAYTTQLVAYVRSSGNPNKMYAVSIDPQTDLFVCECPDQQWRRRDCKHVKAVQRGEGCAALPKPPATTTPAPAPVRQPSGLPKPTREEVDELWTPRKVAA